MEIDKNVSQDVLNRARSIKVILMDVDGVMTAGKIVYDSRGVEIKHFNAHDGLAIKLASAAGIKTGIISSRESGTIRTRAAELKMDYLYLGRYDKLTALRELQETIQVQLKHICFIGDDLPDIPIMKEVGLAIAVNNATEMTKSYAHYVSQKSGGEGAVREVVEIILESQNMLEHAINKIWE